MAIGLEFSGWWTIRRFQCHARCPSYGAADLAEREGVDVPTIGLAFVLAHPARPVALPGSLNLERLTQAQQALSVQLDRTDVYQIIQASMGEALP